MVAKRVLALLLALVTLGSFASCVEGNTSSSDAPAPLFFTAPKDGSSQPQTTAKRYKLSVYPEFWASESHVSDPGNQEHCSWQVYAMSYVFPELSMKNQEDQ